MKKIWIAVQVEENGKYYAYALYVTEYTNLVSRLSIPHIVTANIFPTKKSAFETVEQWNKAFKDQNIYMFDETF